MKALKKLLIGIVCAAVMMTSAATVLADETSASQPAQTGESTTSTFDISKMSFDTMYGNQVMDFLNHQYEFDGQKIPLTESNYYFLLTFLQLSQYAAYGYYPATGAGYIDLAAKYGETGKTYADYYVEQAEQYLYSTYIFVQRAKAAGIKLEKSDKDAIDEEVKERIEQQAKPAGVSLDVILQLYFGPQFDEKAYRSVLENATLAGKYQEKYAKDYKIPADQMMVPSIRYALFYAPGASASADDKKKAENAANELLAKCKNLDDLKKLAEAGQKDGSIYDQGDISVRKGEVVSSFETWAFEASRKAGDIGVIYSQEYGYFVVGYVGKVKLEQDEVADVASEALNAEIEKEMKENKHNFHTNQKFSPAKPAPTAVPEEPGEGDPMNSETLPSAIATDDGSTTPDNGMSKILIIVFVAIGGVAIIAVIAILVMNYKNSGKDDEESEEKSSKKKSKRVIKEEDDEDEDEYDEDEDEDEEPVEQEDPYSGISGDESEEEKSSDDEDKKNKKKTK